MDYPVTYSNICSNQRQLRFSMNREEHCIESVKALVVDSDSYQESSGWIVTWRQPVVLRTAYLPHPYRVISYSAPNTNLIKTASMFLKFTLR